MPQNRPWTNTWSIIQIEGYCAIDWEYEKKKNKYSIFYELKDNGEFGDRDRRPNPDYDPSVKRNPLPKFCKKRICYTCLENDCPHLSYAEYEFQKGDEEWLSDRILRPDPEKKLSESIP